MNEVGEKITKLVSLGGSNAGLDTVGYTIVAGDGSVYEARTTSGVYEIGGGWYGVELDATIFPAFFEGRIDWDIAAAFKASDELYVSARLDAEISSRSVYDGSDTPGITTLLGRLTATRAGLLDNLANLVAEIVDGVWDELLAGHSTDGSAGEALAGAGSAGDPWATPLPGSYGGDEAGAILAAIEQKTALITTGAPITLETPVTTGGSVLIIQGDDYKAADGRALQWNSDSWPDLLGATIELELRFGATVETEAGTVLSASEVQVELTSAVTAALPRTVGRYALRATLSDGDTVTLADGAFDVTGQS